VNDYRCFEEHDLLASRRLWHRSDKMSGGLQHDVVVHCWYASFTDGKNLQTKESLVGGYNNFCG